MERAGRRRRGMLCWSLSLCRSEKEEERRREAAADGAAEVIEPIDEKKEMKLEHRPISS